MRGTTRGGGATPRLSRALLIQLIVAVAVVVGAALFAVAFAQIDREWGPAWLLVAVVAAEVAAHVRPVSLPIGREVHDFEFEEAVLVAAAFVLPPRGLLVALVVGIVANNLVRRRQPLKQLFNVGVYMGGASLCVLVMQAITDLPPDTPTLLAPVAAITGVLVLAAYTELAVSGVISVAGQRRFRDVIKPELLVTSGASMFGATVGALIGMAGSWYPPALVFALPPIVATAALLRRFADSMEQGHRLDGLLRTAIEANAVLGRGEVEASLVSAARQLLRASTARIGEQPGEGEVAALVSVEPKDTWLIVGGRSDRSPFTAGDRRMLEGIAAIGAAAMKNALLLERMRDQATHDALTGLPNLLLFEDRVRTGILAHRRTGERLAVAFLDLDRFKRVNDVLGHPAGDEVLRQAGRRLQDALRAGDTVCRIGGDEFTFFLPSVADASAAAQVLERAVESLRDPFVVDGHEIRLTASVGVALFPDDGDDYDTLVRRADVAMYHGKDRGRDVIQPYVAEFEGDVSGALALESELHRALDRDEIWVAYQPQVDVRSGEVVGVEALVRWRHPIFGDIRPDHFLPLAQDSGLISSIDWFVLETSLAQLASWHRMGMTKLRLSVNFSSRLLHSAHLAPRVLGAVVAAGVAPDRLEVELTEQVVAREGEQVEDALARLRTDGVRVAIDDFGTGYSSLARLRRFPVDVIKIDKTFIRDIDAGGDAAIAVSAIDMAHRLGCEVVAEGVETPEQLEFLRRHGCDTSQGYLTGRPCAVAEMEQRLRLAGVVGVHR